MIRRKLTLKSGHIQEIVIWNVPQSHKYPDGVRYRLALVDPEHKQVLVLFDNHYPKGHHKHFRNGREEPIIFIGIKRLIKTFLNAVEELENES